MADFRRSGDPGRPRRTARRASTVHTLNQYSKRPSRGGGRALIVELHGGRCGGKRGTAPCRNWSPGMSAMQACMPRIDPGEQLWAALHKSGTTPAPGIAPGAPAPSRPTSACLVAARPDSYGNLGRYCGDAHYQSRCMATWGWKFPHGGPHPVKASESQSVFPAYSPQRHSASRHRQRRNSVRASTASALGKQRYCNASTGLPLDWIRHIKRLFDPRGVMNPGKNVAWAPAD